MQMAHTRAVNFYSKVADWMSHTSDAPIFHPTQEEWEKPMAFMRSIRPQAERHGGLLLTTGKSLRVRSVTQPA